MNQLLDVKGMACPLPILKAKKALNGLNIGDELEILATDPGSVQDFDAFCATTGQELVTSEEDGGVYRFVVRKVV